MEQQNKQNDLSIYTASYSHNHRSQGFYVKASTWEEAEAKLKAFQETATIDGVLDTIVGAQTGKIHEQPEVNNYFLNIDDTVL